MHALFLKILNMSLAAGVLTLAVLLLRLPLRRAPKWLRCLLWALVALRLVCPWTPRSSLSAFSLLPAKTDERGAIEYFRYNGRTEKPLLEFDVPRVSFSAPAMDTAPDAPDAQAQGAQTLTVRTASRYLPVLETVWLAGAGAMLLYAAGSWLLLRRRVRRSVPLGGGLWLCEEVDSPFILGVFRPRVYLPAGLSDADRAAVVAHETAHLRRGDQLWKPLGFLLLAAYWFNPLLWLAWGLLCRDIELACDERVVRDMALGARADYSQALLDLNIRHRLVRVCPLAFGEGSVKGRVKAVLNYKKPAFWIVLAAVLACAALGVFFLTNPKGKAGDAAAEKTPWSWTSTVTAAGIKSCELSGGYTLSEEEVALLVEKLNAVPKEAVQIGRGIPSNVVLDVTTGPGYRLRFAGGIIELDFDDQEAAAELYGRGYPGVWEIRDEALYEFLNDLWARSQHNVSPEVQTVLREVLCTDGAQAEAAMDRLTSGLMQQPKETLETMGAYPEGVRDWLCWSLAAHVQGMALDTDAPLSVEGLNPDGAAARDRIVGYFRELGEAPKSWQQLYQEFEASGQMGDYSAAALMDFDFDGVPELVVWRGGSVRGYAESDVSSALILYLGGGKATVYATDGAAVSPIEGGEYRTDAFFETPKSSTQPLSQTRRFLLLRDKETGQYAWWVNAGVDENGKISGSFEPLSAPDEDALPYESYGARQEAAVALLERNEPVALNYAAFTILHAEGSDKNAFLRLVNGWRCYDVYTTDNDPDMPTAVHVTDPLSSTFNPYGVERRDLVEQLWGLYRNMEVSGRAAEPTAEELRANRILFVTFKRGEETLAQFSIFGKYLAKVEQDSEDTATFRYFEIRDGEAFYQAFLAALNSGAGR